MRKLSSIFLSAFIFWVGLSGGVLAASSGPVPTSSPAATPAAISSYEMFWPIVAGKTLGDPTYFVKLLNENIRGLLIFNLSEKADNAVFLATKRVVEAEKLIKGGKSDLADKTLYRAGVWLDKATLEIQKASFSKNASYRDRVTNMSNRLVNLKIFIPRLISETGINEEGLSKVLEKVTFLESKL